MNILIGLLSKYVFGVVIKYIIECLLDDVLNYKIVIEQLP